MLKLVYYASYSCAVLLQGVTKALEMRFLYEYVFVNATGRWLYATIDIGFYCWHAQFTLAT